MLFVVAGFVALATIAVLLMGDDMLATPSPDPHTVVQLVEGPRTGCGSYKSVWDARTPTGDTITICDHSGYPYPSRGNPATSLRLGDYVAIGPGSFWQLLGGRFTWLLFGGTIARIVAWVGSTMVPRATADSMASPRRTR